MPMVQKWVAENGVDLWRRLLERVPLT